MRLLAPSLPLLFAAVTLVSCGSEEIAEPAADPLRSDKRIAPLLVLGKQHGFYDRFVDDMIPVLVEKLKTSGGDPLKRAKEELGDLGEPAAVELRRLFEESFSDAFLSAYLENALDAVGRNPTDEAHALLLRALDHPMESVRNRAMLAIVAHHARPEDFDLLAFRFQSEAEPPELRKLYLRAMFLADPARAGALGVAWLQEKQYQPFWINLCAHLSEVDDDDVGRACAALYEELSHPKSLQVATPAARAGVPEAIAFLRASLDGTYPSERILAARALGDAGHTELLEPALLDETDANVKIMAIDAILRQEEHDPQQLEWVATALTDADPEVRAHALKVLCELGYEPALSEAISMLGDNAKRLGSALRALREPLKDPAFSKRALERLMEVHDLESHRPLDERLATFKAIGLVQLPEAARFLRETALAETELTTLEGLRTHEWLMIHASNTGAEGRRWLFDQLAVETDPLRRIDLLSAACSTRAPEERAAVRERLLELCEGAAQSGLELLYAAERAAKIGPSRVVAPRLLDQL